MGRFGRVLATLAILVGGLLVVFSTVDLASHAAIPSIELQDGLMILLGALCIMLGVSAFRRRQ
jgi:hypothetical protein